LLLEDLSDTHASNWNVKPTWESATKTIDAMAKIHASWWNHPQLSTVGKFPNENVIKSYLSHPAQGLIPMLGEVGETLPQQWLDIIHCIFDKHGDKLKERASKRESLTCIHGDPNPGNILSPIDPSGQTFLIDRQLFDWSLSIWLGVSDVAYMMIHWWRTEIRRQLEKPLLQRYHQRLQELGIQNYSFTELWNDYRLCAMQSIYVVTAWCVNEVERREYKWVWLPQLKKTMTACLDLECIELLH
jgi:thiamine kinase-like enzyme